MNQPEFYGEMEQELIKLYQLREAVKEHERLEKTAQMLMEATSEFHEYNTARLTRTTTEQLIMEQEKKINSWQRKTPA